MSNNTIKINEFADLSPFGLEKYDEIEGYSINSSESITNRIKELVLHDSRTKPIARIIHDGLDSKQILVGFTESPLKILWRDIKSWLAYIDIFNIFSGNQIQTMGFFSTTHRKVVLLLDPSVNILGGRFRKIVPKITHELCHWVANESRSRFISNAMDDFLYPFYKNLFGLVAKDSKKIPDSILIKSIANVVLLNERNISKPRQTMIKTFIIWQKFLLNVYDKKEANQIVKFLLIPYLAFATSQIKPKYMSTALESIRYYYKAYNNSFGLDVTEITVPGQEFRLPSEIVAVYNEMNLDSKIANLIRNLPVGVIR